MGERHECVVRDDGDKRTSGGTNPIASECRKAEVSNTGATILADQDVGLDKRTSDMRQCNLEITTHSFQISVDHLEVVHIPQALCDVDELNTSAKG